MNEWIDDLSDLAASREAAVLVTIANVRGSAPRETGAKMIVTASETIGTIGGGQLEHQCTRLAVDMLGDEALPSLRQFPLGSAMGQCCGGVVDVLFESIQGAMPFWLAEINTLHRQREPAVLVTGADEAAGKFVVTADRVSGAVSADDDIVSTAREILRDGASSCRRDAYFYDVITPSDFNIAVFGAGHVGAALVAALSTLDCNIRWIDSRRRIFRKVPANVRAIEAEDPALEVAALPPQSHFLVMTHSHALDFDICTRILARNDVAYAGLIGSQSKRRRFEKRFRQAGLTAPQVERLVCPIGVKGISGKKPAEIAVAAAAELLQAREKQQQQDVLPDNVHPLRR